MVKAEWILYSSYYDKEENKCSLCGFLVTNKVGKRFNYCPECGAKMEEMTENVTTVNKGKGTVMGSYRESGLAIGSQLEPKTLQIDKCDRIILRDKSLEFVCEIPVDMINQFDEININGIVFKKRES